MAAGTVLMRFLILTQYFPPEVGAPQTRLSSLCRALRAHGHEVEVVTAVPNYPFGRIDERYRRTVMWTEEMDGVTVRRVLMYPAMGSGTKRLVSYASFTAMCVIGLVRSKRADHVFVESPPLFLAVPGRLVAWLWRATAIFNVADLWPDAAVDLGLLGPGLPLRVLQAIERWAYRSYDVVNSVTDSVRRVLTDGKGIPSESCSTSRTGSTRNCSDPSLLSDGPCTISPTRWCTPGRSDTSMRPSTSSVRSLRCSPNGAATFGSGSLRHRIRTRSASRPCRPARVGDRVVRRPGAAAGARRDPPGRLGGRRHPGGQRHGPQDATVEDVSDDGERPARAVLRRRRGADMVQREDAGVVCPNAPEAIADAIEQLIDGGRADELGANGRAFVERDLSWNAIVDRWLVALEQVR
ncbi:MAG: glycosyltransferase family 4 protein [Ilumatobacteraceae bacterium]